VISTTADQLELREQVHPQFRYYLAPTTQPAGSHPE